MRHRPDLAAAGALLMIGLYRVVSLVIRGEPTGYDFGNWLFLGHQMLGHPLHGAASITYPPLVPVTASILTGIVGPLWANALLVGFGGVIPAAGVYVVARLANSRWAALPGIILLAATSSTGEAVAWGGAPQLIGFGAAVAALGFAVQLTRVRSLKTAVILGVLLLLVAATSHLVFAQLVLTLVIAALIAVALNWRSFGAGTWTGRRGWMALMAVACAPLLVLVPLYVTLFSTVGQSFAGQQQAARGLASLDAFLANLWVVYRDVPWLWKSLLALTAATPLLFIRARTRNLLWVVTTAVVVSLLLQALASSQDRLVYLAPIVVASAMTMWIDEIARGHVPLPEGRLAVAAVVLLVGVSAVGTWRGLQFFPKQRDFYGALVPKGTIAGLSWLRANTPTRSLVLAAPVNGAPFGWWVQGYGERPALVATEDQWLNFPAEKARAHVAVALLSISDPLGSEALVDARHHHVSYLVIPWAWGGLSRRQLAVFRERSPRQVLFDNHAMVIIKVTA